MFCIEFDEDVFILENDEIFSTSSSFFIFSIFILLFFFAVVFEGTNFLVLIIFFVTK
jgi:hypothetical protein